MLFRMVEALKDPSINFSLAISLKKRISSQNSLNFIFNRFATLLHDFQAIPTSSPKSLNLNQDQVSSF